MARPRRPLVLGVNRLSQYMSTTRDQPPRTEEEWDAHFLACFEESQKRLLERATQGLLTWAGDEIIHTRGRCRRPRVHHEQTTGEAGVLTPGKVPGKVPGEAAEQMAGEVGGQTAEQIAGEVAGEIPGEIPGEVLEQVQ